MEVIIRGCDFLTNKTFLHGRSCLTNLLEAFEEWTKALDDGYGIDVIYLDYRKAFDSVPHKKRAETKVEWHRWKDHGLGRTIPDAAKDESWSQWQLLQLGRRVKWSSTGFGAGTVIVPSVR